MVVAVSQVTSETRKEWRQRIFANIDRVRKVDAEVRYNSQHTLQKTEYRIQNTEYRIQNTEYRIQNTEYRIQNTEYRIQNTEHRIQKLMYMELPMDLSLRRPSTVHNAFVASNSISWASGRGLGRFGPQMALA